MFLVCVRDELETGTDCYIDHKFFFDQSSTSFSSWLGCSTVGHWGSQSPQSASWFSRWHPLFNWLKLPGHLVILLSNVHPLPLFFRLFRQVHLLIDGSVEGQYITIVDIFLVWKMVYEFHKEYSRFYRDEELRLKIVILKRFMVLERRWYE